MESRYFSPQPLLVGATLSFACKFLSRVPVVPVNLQIFVESQLEFQQQIMLTQTPNFTGIAFNHTALKAGLYVAMMQYPRDDNYQLRTIQEELFVQGNSILN